MEVISLKKENMADYGKTALGDVYSAHVKITDIKSRATDMIDIISNTSWIDKLGAVEQVTFKARAQRTIDKLVNDILTHVIDEVTVEFGEYMVSDTAQSVLESEYTHTKIPLADLIKEKVTGNPGFDFHTESSTNLIAFGEAKYSGVSNPHGKALNQIVSFIGLEKDCSELTTLSNFVSKPSVTNFLAGKKSYIAAFSVNSDNPQNIINNALNSDAIDALLEYPEVYVIGVEVDA